MALVWSIGFEICVQRMDHCLHSDTLGLCAKARTEQELLGVVSEFEKQFGKVDGIF